MRAQCRFLLLIGAIAALCSVMLVPAGADALTWSPPRVIDDQAPFGTANVIGSFSCPSKRLCVAVDGSGSVLTSTNPAGGPDAWKVAANVDPSGALDSVSCPSTSLCVAVDSAGNVFSSRTPTGGRSAWKLAAGAIAHPNQPEAVSCASASLCLASDRAGDVVVSKNPTGGPRAWRTVRIFKRGRDHLVAVSCPTESLCMGLDSHGNRLANSLNPSGGASSWRLSSLPVHGTVTPGTIACAGTLLCVITGTSDAPSLGTFVLSTTIPAGANPPWRLARKVASGSLASVSCPSYSFCLAGGGGDGEPALYSHHPTGTRGAWKVAYRAKAGATLSGTSAVACAAAVLCVLGDYLGNVVTSTNPAGGQGAWTPAPVDAVNNINGVSCASSSFCALADSAGRVLTSSDPGASAATWTGAVVSTDGAGIQSLSCASASLCAAGEQRGSVTASSSPTGGPSAWHQAILNDEASVVNGMSCPSASLCVGVDWGVYTDSSSDISAIETSTNPTGGDSAWETTFDSGTFEESSAVLRAVSCATTTMCVAVDSGGNTVTSTNPTSGHWTVKKRDPGHALQGISCPSAALCVAVDNAGNAVTSTQPSSGTWTISAIDPGASLNAVSCSAANFCAAVDSTGNILTSSNPTGGPSAWSRADQIADALLSISCTGVPLCVAGGRAGEIVVGS